MPWISLIIFLISTFLSASKKGKVTAKDVAIGAAAGVASYMLIDPANPNAVFSSSPTTSEEATPIPGSTTGAATPVTTTPGALGTLSTVTGQAAGVLQSWGPAGTVGVIAGTSAATGSGIFGSDTLKKWLPWIIIGGAFLFLTK